MNFNNSSINIYDAIIIGGGHAGCEAAAASARAGASSLLITHHIDKIGEMSCNPAIGGVGKGHLVREIDALDGIMGRAADLSGIQFRVLNRSKGPAVHGPRTQADRKLYKQAIQNLLKTQENLKIISGTVEDLIISQNKVTGVILDNGEKIYGITVILTTGTFLGGMIHIGNKSIPAGRIGEKASYGLSKTLAKYQFPLGRLKTGTPPRLRASTINWKILEKQAADVNPIPFSFMSETLPNPQIECAITYSNPNTHKIIKDNIQLSAIYSGKIKSVGPRYCPSIEDKIIRFAERQRHQIFLEPEGLKSDVIYPNGISTALPEEVQTAYIQSISGLEQCQILQYGYAVEYDYVDPRALYLHLETKKIENLFFAGQINGTTGYEEAAAQGILAGINAAQKASGKPPLTLERTNSYIGVMIDDLTQKGVQEPYRMFTSRAEYRLWLRADNADERLHKFGIAAGTISKKRNRKWIDFYQELTVQRKILNEITLTPDQIQKSGITVKQDGKKRSAMEWLSLPAVTWQNLSFLIRNDNEAIKSTLTTKPKIIEKLEIDALYAHYLIRQTQDIAIYQRDKNLILPNDLDFSIIAGLSHELQQKLTTHRPTSLAAAAKISGMTPAALLLLLRYIKKASKNDPSVNAA